jgi:hypothetical protein
MEMDFHKGQKMQSRDFQTISLFAILGLLTVAFVFVSRAVLFGPSAGALEDNSDPRGSVVRHSSRP